MHADPFGLELGGQLGHQHAGHSAIFVASVLANQVTVRFLGAKREMLGTHFIHEAANPFESHEQV